MRNLLLVILGIICLTACKEDTKEDFELDSLGYNYYPVELGKYWIYQVDSVTYIDLGAIKDTTRSYLREEIVEEFVDQVGDTIYRIERKVSATSDYDWKVKDEWATEKQSNRVTRTEENLKYIKLVFPPTKSIAWDGNAFIPEGIEISVGGETIDFFLDWSYKILSVDQTETIGDIEYDNVLEIQNADSDELDLLHRRYVIEKYAREVGLVYKKHLILNTQCIEECEGMTWEEKASKGYTLEMTLLEHGQ